MLSLNYKKAMHVWRHYVDFWNFPGRTICNSTLLYSMTADILIPECWPQMSSSWYQLIHNYRLLPIRKDNSALLIVYRSSISHRENRGDFDNIRNISEHWKFFKIKIHKLYSFNRQSITYMYNNFFYFLQIYTELCYSALYMYLYIKKNGFHYVLREGTFSVFH